MMTRYALLGTLPWLGLATTLVGAKPTSSPTHTKQEPEILVQGLKVWRKPGAINNAAACATCHSPDGIDLAVYNFSDDDIMRRALRHLPPEDCSVLVQYIHALRTKYQFSTLRDPMEDRPLQPGGKVLPGSTPAERDLAFGKELAETYPLLFGAPIKSLDEAKAAEAQILSVPANTLRIGIPLNRISEDVAHGNEHASIAQWFPEIEPTVPSANLADWYVLEDQYLKSPTPENLHLLVSKHREWAPESRMSGLAAISAAKFNALLVWQDRVRNHTENSTKNVSSDVLIYSNFNPIWQVGEVARQMVGRGARELGMDADTIAKKTIGPSVQEQVQQLRLSWFWAGWLSDQGLFKTSLDPKTKLGMWQAQSLSQDGPYPIHSVYTNVRRQAVISNDPEAWGETLHRKRRLWDFAGLRSFDYQQQDIPTQPENRKLYFKFLCNSIRMNLYLVKDSIDKTGIVWIRLNSRANARILADFVKKNDPGDETQMDKLLADLNQSIDKAIEKVAK